MTNAFWTIVECLKCVPGSVRELFLIGYSQNAELTKCRTAIVCCIEGDDVRIQKVQAVLEVVALELPLEAFRHPQSTA